MNWMEFLDERQQKELRFAKVYANEFSHGTDGHNRLNLIAHLARILDITSALLEESTEKEEWEAMMAEVRNLLNKTT